MNQSLAGRDGVAYEGGGIGWGELLHVLGEGFAAWCVGEEVEEHGGEVVAGEG